MTNLTNAMTNCLNQARNSHKLENTALKAPGCLAGKAI